MFPDATQIISVLHSIQSGGNVLLGIDTGQGKSTSTALQNAMLWCEGHTVDSCSNNMDNATRDKTQHEDFYRYIGAEVAVIDDNTNVGKITGSRYDGPYKEQGIHYSTRTKLALYREKCVLEGLDFKKLFKTPISLNYDEFDSAALDDTSLTILSEGSTAVDPFNNPDKWIYPLINRFVDFLDKKLSDAAEKQFIQNCFRAVKEKYTIAEEVFALREYLYLKAAHEDKPRLTDKLIHLQLNMWIKSARKARSLYNRNLGDQKDKDYCVVQEQRAVDGQNIQFSRAVIMEGGFPSYEARWQDGVHQLLHARHDEEVLLNGGVKFICDQERKILASSTSKNFFDYYSKDVKPRTRIIGNTATPGSENIEVPELQEDYQLQVDKMPPHQKSNRKTLPAIYGRNLDDQMQKLAEVIRNEMSPNKLREYGNKGPAPILICCQDIPSAVAITEKLRTLNLSRYKITELNGKMSEQNRKTIIENAGQPVEEDRVVKGRITISTVSGIGTDIKTDHPEGLLTCSTYASSYRKEKQIDGRSGRRGKKGRVIHTYNDEVMQRDYGVTLSDKSPEEIDIILKKIQNELDFGNQRNRHKINRGGDIVRLVQEQLNQCYIYFVNSGNPNLEEFKKEFTKVRKYIVEELNKTWDEMFSDLVVNHKMSPAEQLNHVTEQYIPFVNKLWIRKSHELSKLGIPDELLRFKVENHFARNKKPKIDYTKQQPVEDKYVTYFKNQIAKPKDKIVDLVQFFRNTANSKVANKLGAANVMAYKQTHKGDMLTNAKEYVTHTLEEYLKKWNVGNDRRSHVDSLLHNDNYSIASQIDFTRLIARLNEAALVSFADDCRINSEAWIFHRGSSRFRNEVIFKSKMYVYSNCPPAELESVAKLDLIDLRNYLQRSLDHNPYYTADNEIKGLLRNVLNDLPTNLNTIANPTEKLIKAISGLRRIINSANYKDEVSGLLEMTVALDYLSVQLKSVAELKDSQYQRVYKSMQKELAKIDIKEPSYISSIFGSPYDIPDNSNSFTDILGTHAIRRIPDTKERYHLHEVMKCIHGLLASDKYGAHQIEFEYANSQLKVKFKLTDAKTLAVSDNEILVHIDMKGKTYIPEPVVSATLPVQSIPAAVGPQV